MSGSYVVTGQYVTVKTMTNEGPRILGLHSGAPIPADADPEYVKHLVAHNLAAKVDEPKAEAPKEAAKPAASAHAGAAGAGVKASSAKADE